MLTPRGRTEMEQNIAENCHKLFLTSAIPDMCQRRGAPKQLEYLHEALELEIQRRCPRRNWKTYRSLNRNRTL